LEATVDLGPGGSQSTPSSLSGLTATGSVLGTPAYMAPEQWAGGTVGPSADQFAYCVALWEALTGERPFRGPTLDELKREVARGPPAVAKPIARDVDSWRTLRAHACTEPADKRAPKLACFDGIVARAQAVHLAAVRAGQTGSPDDVLDSLVDPAVCAGANPPRL